MHPCNYLETPKRRSGWIEVFLGKKEELQWNIAKAPVRVCISIVTVVAFQVNGFPRHDLAFLLGTGCNGQQWV